MNEIFDIKRLWKLMQYEVVNYIPNFFKSLLIFASVIAAVWIFSLTVDYSILPNGRDSLVGVLFMFAVALSPFVIYKDMNDRKKGYIYAMTPASTLEKLLSMIVLCVVVVPVLSYSVLTATDLLLHLLTKAGMGSFSEMVLYNPFDAIVATNVEDLNACSLPVLDGILGYLNLTAYTIMFNTIFRKNKVLKTILFNISVIFVLVILTAVVANMTSPEFWENLFSPLDEWLEGKTDVELFRYLMIAGRCVSVLFSALFFVISYFRIKRVNY